MQKTTESDSYYNNLENMSISFIYTAYTQKVGY